MNRPGIPSHGQPPDPSLWTLGVLAAVAVALAAVSLRSDLRRYLWALEPLPWHRRLFVTLRHRLR